LRTILLKKFEQHEKKELSFLSKNYKLKWLILTIPLLIQKHLRNGLIVKLSPSA